MLFGMQCSFCPYRPLKVTRSVDYDSPSDTQISGLAPPQDLTFPACSYSSPTPAVIIALAVSIPGVECSDEVSQRWFSS